MRSPTLLSHERRHPLPPCFPGWKTSLQGPADSGPRLRVFQRLDVLPCDLPVCRLDDLCWVAIPVLQVPSISFCLAACHVVRFCFPVGFAVFFRVLPGRRRTWPEPDKQLADSVQGMDSSPFGALRASRTRPHPAPTLSAGCREADWQPWLTMDFRMLMVATMLFS